MKHFYTIIIGFGILLVTGLSSCSIAIKAIYNQFSDRDEFVLFNEDRKMDTEDRKMETAGQSQENGNSDTEKEWDWEADLMDGFEGDSI